MGHLFDTHEPLVSFPPPALTPYKSRGKFSRKNEAVQYCTRKSVESLLADRLVCAVL